MKLEILKTIGLVITLPLMLLFGTLLLIAALAEKVITGRQTLIHW